MKGRIAALVALLFLSSAAADYSAHPRVPELLAKLRADYGFTEAEIAGVEMALAQAEQIPKLIEAEQTAKERTATWADYRKFHVFDANVANGMRFLAEYRA